MGIDMHTSQLVAMKLVKLDALAEKEIRILKFIGGVSDEYFAHLLACFPACGSSAPGDRTGSSQLVSHSVWLVFPWYDLTVFELWRSRRGVFCRPEVVQLAQHLFRGLTHLHAANICHGDLSFANLLVRASAPSGSQPAIGFVLVIADFGSASFLPVTERPRCSEHVAAPELCLQLPASQVTCAVDVWAAGIFVVSLATGTFLCENMNQMVQVLGGLTDVEWPGISERKAYCDLDVLRLSARYPKSLPE